MIQRIQTLYLLITVLLSGLFLTGSILQTADSSGNGISMSIGGIYRTAGNSAPVRTGEMIPFAVISGAIPVIALATLFLYKKRKLQIKLTVLLLCFEVLLVIAGVYYFLVLLKNPAGNIIPGYRSVIPLLTVIFTVLAYRGVRKDENLIKSYDRLR